jgi:hypothetical protein
MSNDPHTHKELTALIKKISGQANFIGTPRIYVDIFEGDLVVAVWFNQVVYWDGKNKEPIGFYKTYKEWNEELGLSEYQVRRAAKLCQDKGLVNIMFKKVYGTPKNHYLVVWPELLKVLNRTLNTPDPEETKGSESEGSEGEENAGSKEGKKPSGSLSIEESTTESIDIEELKQKDFIIEVLKPCGIQLWPKTPRTWWDLEAKIRAAKLAVQDGVLVISGFGMEAAMYEQRLAKTFNNFLIVNKIGGFTSLTFQE